MRGGDLEARFDVLAHRVGDRRGKFTHAGGLHEPARLLETLQGDLEILQNPRARSVPPTPPGIDDGDQQQGSRHAPKHQSPGK
jgi:hypothetical protein